MDLRITPPDQINRKDNMIFVIPYAMYSETWNYRLN